MPTLSQIESTQNRSAARLSEGLHVALLGIDGIGKSLLCNELKSVGESAGQVVEVVSWRRVVQGAIPCPDSVLVLLRDLWVSCFRLAYGGGSVDAEVLKLPWSYSELLAHGETEYLLETDVRGVRSSGPLAAVWVETAANTLIRDEIIRPLVQSGAVVIEESFGYKPVMRNIVAYEHASGGWNPVSEDANQFASYVYGTVLSPDVGIYLAGSPHLALRWRHLEGRKANAFEGLSSLGEDPEESYLAVQSECAVKYEIFSQKYNWLRVDIEDSPRAVNRVRIISALRGTRIDECLGLR